MSYARWSTTSLSLVLAAAACAPAAVSTNPAAPSSPHYDAQVAPAAFAGLSAPAIVPSLLFGARPGERAVAWTGSYAGGPQHGGTLTVRLRERAPGDLVGDLVVWVAPRADTFAPRGAHPGAAERVAVLLAEAHHDAGRLVLATEPYYDPGCGCTVTGTYRGVIRGDTLTGTYVTSGAATTTTARGRWRVVRGAEPAPEHTASAPSAATPGRP